MMIVTLDHLVYGIRSVIQHLLAYVLHLRSGGNNKTYYLIGLMGVKQLNTQ